MDAFIRHYQSLLLSLMALIAGIGVLGYSVLYSPTRAWTDDLQQLSGLFEMENRELKALSAKLDQRKAQFQTAEDVAIRDLPAFLRNLNEVARTTSVVLRELTPAEPGNRGPRSGIRFVISLIADYETFLRFTAGLESLNVVIEDMQVRPYDPASTPPRHLVSFTITPRQDAAPLTGERVGALRTAVAEKGRRNPFQRFMWEDTKTQVVRQIDLTYIHRLTGIARVGDQRVATIDSRDYRVGDQLSGMQVTEILSDRILLRKGSDQFVVKFRMRFGASPTAAPGGTPPRP